MTPPHAIPPTLPPSVEESYRRKCIQLKQRMNEVDETNAASTLRLARMHRGIEKLRLERAFLLEQLAKRTSTNVEDSEGSPSPPPTPKEKPLRTKRGHRKPSFLASLESGRGSMSAFAPNAGGATATLSASPSSEAFSHSALPAQQAQTHVPSTAAAHAPNGSGTASQARETISTPRRKPKNAFELFAHDTRGGLVAEHRKEIKEGAYDVHQELTLLWERLGPEGQEEWQLRFDRQKELARARREAARRDTSKANGPVVKIEQPPTNGETADEDVEMAEEALVEDEK
ncbi:MAG: hypothetical protein M1818_007867 [Claussenomyces sp. TS43310]|nr:MAG: hypothetical protein M1818_007867 [Claussenomyces sp. TS43310]